MSWNYIGQYIKKNFLVANTYPTLGILFFYKSIKVGYYIILLL